MPRSQYGGMSNFFDSPAGRALMQTAGEQEPSFGAGAQGGLLATMRPGLRNALADAYGRDQLDSLERKRGSVVDLGPGLGGETSRPFYVDPRIADAETARGQFRSNAMLEDELTGMQETGAYRRKAEGDDYAADLAARRYWEPRSYSMREDDMQRKLRLATEPARIAADSREQVASTTGASRVSTAQATAGGRLTGEAIKNYDDWVKSGAFGIDERTGMPKTPPPEVANFMQNLLGRTAGATSQPMSPDIEAEIDRGVRVGYSRDEIVAHLRQIGRIK